MTVNVISNLVVIARGAILCDGNHPVGGERHTCSTVYSSLHFLGIPTTCKWRFLLSVATCRLLHPMGNPDGAAFLRIPTMHFPQQYRLASNTFNGGQEFSPVATTRSVAGFLSGFCKGGKGLKILHKGENGPPPPKQTLPYCQ